MSSGGDLVQALTARLLNLMQGRSNGGFQDPFRQRIHGPADVFGECVRFFLE